MTAVPLHDIVDARRYVGHVIARHPLLSQLLDREETEAEGLLAIVELAARYSPEHGQSFSTYAGHLLPKRILDAHNRAHCVKRRTDAGRVWEPRAVLSLDRESMRPGFSEQRVRPLGAFVRL